MLIRFSLLVASRWRGLMRLFRPQFRTEGLDRIVSHDFCFNAGSPLVNSSCNSKETVFPKHALAEQYLNDGFYERPDCELQTSPLAFRRGERTERKKFTLACKFFVFFPKTIGARRRHPTISS